MSLSEQFLLALMFPLGFAVLAAYAWRGARERGRSRPYWLLALISAFVWSSSILTFYGGERLPMETAVAWRVIGRHALSLMSVWILLATAGHVGASRRLVRAVVALGLSLWFVSLLLDPILRPLPLRGFALVGQTIQPFFLWAAFWVTAWLLPLLGALLMTRRAAVSVASALTRNRLNYWRLGLILFLVGGLIAIVQQPRQPFWQELGAMPLLLAAWIGTRSLNEVNLPGLRLTMRRLSARLATALLTFAVTGALLWLFTQRALLRGGAVSQVNLLLFAALFTALFFLLNRIVPVLVRRLLLPQVESAGANLQTQPGFAASLLSPTAFGELFLRQIQFHLAAERALLFTAEAGPAGNLLLHPLTTVDHSGRLSALHVAGDSPFAHYLRHLPAQPLATVELESAPPFATAPTSEKLGVAAWRAALIVPLHTGEQLVGLVALGEKYTGAPYSSEELHWLQILSVEAAPLLVQAQRLQNLLQIGGDAFRQLDQLQQERQELRELVELHRQFAAQVSPRLREPLVALTNRVQVLTDENGNEPVLGAVSEELSTLRKALDRLILMAERVRQQAPFEMDAVHLDEVITQAVANMEPMASGRRVKLQVEIAPKLPVLYGDGGRLSEALQYLLHNAIKFNRIGGEVHVNCGTDGERVYIHIRDTGVGIPPERLDTLWRKEDEPLQQPGRLRNPTSGLLLARFLIRAHGGEIAASSEYGSGSTFSIYLPLVLPGEDGVTPQQPVTSQHASPP